MVSAACVRLDAAKRELSWALAGHPPPLLLPRLEALSPSGETLPIGASADLTLSTAAASLGDGDGVLVYTDGATDVRQRGDLLGTEGFLGFIEPLTGLPAKELVAELQRAILEWADQPIGDDLCVLALWPKAGAT